jgi:hypothetical protein
MASVSRSSWMHPKKKAKKDYGKATLASVKKKMGKPRMAKSARKKHANLALTAVLREARKSSSREVAEVISRADYSRSSNTLLAESLAGLFTLIII